MAFNVPTTRSSNVDTEFDQNEEENDKVAGLDGEESGENFGTILSSKGFDGFQAPPARRATYQKGRAPPDER